MAELRSDSAISRRVVRAFLDFLKSVQPAPGVDLEGLDVARECLEECFKLNSFSSDDGVPPGMLIKLFSSLENGAQCKEKSTVSPLMRESTSCTTSYSHQVKDSTDTEVKASNVEDQARGPYVLGGCRDELFSKFFAALDKINFFKTSPNGVEDSAQVAKATELFNDVLMEMENCEAQTINLNNLAEMFKLKGNRSMQSKSYLEAIELYTCAIALDERNAVYYCNRAAAFTQINGYAEAIQDCVKSIEINPSYSKAYSRLGLAYYAQGNYSDALKGFLKALQLDPNNDSVIENIRVTQQKLREQHQQAEAAQNAGSHHGQHSFSFSFDASNPQYPGHSASNSFFSFRPPTPPPPESPAPPPPPEFAAPPPPPEFPDTSQSSTQSAGSTPETTPFPTFPFNASVPEVGDIFRAATEAAASSAPQFAEVLRNMGSPAQGHQSHERRPDGPEIRTDEPPSFSFGEAPQHVQDVLRSVMGMFSSQHGSQQDMHRGDNGA
ncbi:small glutamine-rich tetratricopeptide repeat-containing protein-like isoform X2 [Asparagus officinalis]|uniref:small glutamine-rich tetratricopeptide repeat-containing protein-like isoform X2 n=1 Tax=Asparagus officinalis TaxID=4686 RepID=UPI00098DF9AD|nr:small glutamine-rich tetratricopeptide repeat-containing protein-like isoform X2 [Asparagus officinalis]